MLAERPLPADVADRIADLARAWARDPAIAAVYLFGSRASERFGPCSDVDLGVMLAAGLDATARWRKRLDLLHDATRRLGTDAVDVVIVEDAPSVLAHRILARGRLLCEPDPRRRTVVAADVFRCYLDEAYLRAVLDEGLARRAREGRFAR
jgi:predicted nucleotidyltransferase